MFSRGMINTQNVGPAFAAKFQGTCALSGAQFGAGALIRMYFNNIKGDACTILNSAYGVIANTGWYDHGDSRVVRDFLATSPTQDEMAAFAVANPRAWSGRKLATGQEPHALLDHMDNNPRSYVFVWKNAGNLATATASPKHSFCWSSVYPRFQANGAVKTRKQAEAQILKGAWAFQIVDSMY